MAKLGGKNAEKDARMLRTLLAQATTPAGTTDHGSLLGLGDDDHAQYVHTSAPRTITGQHTFAPAAEQAPFALGVNAQGQVVSGLNADMVDGKEASELLDRSNHTGSDVTFSATAPVTTYPGMLWVQI